MVRLHEPLALHEMRPPEYYEEHLEHRTLLFHALDDSTVPPAPSRRLAALRPDLIRFEPFEGASHTREWNIDPVRWERTLAEFLIDALGIDLDPASLELPVRDPGAAPEPQSIGLRL